MDDEASSDRWLVLTLRPPPRGEEHLLVDALHRLGAGMIDREGERIVAYLPPPGDLDAFLAEAGAVIRSSTTLADPWLEWRWEASEGWMSLWTQEVEERRVSERIVVAPESADPAAREAGEDRPAPVVVRLHPGLAFGTAEHPTTRSCLRLLENLVPKSGGERAGSDVLLDVGTGSGILAIAAALLGARRVVALEADPHACATARQNVALNDVEGRVEVRETEASADDIAGMGPFEGIMANIQPDGLLPLLPGLAVALARGGWLMLSGIPRGERDALLRAADRQGLAADEVVEEAGWWSAVLRGRP